MILQIIPVETSELGPGANSPRNGLPHSRVAWLALSWTAKSVSTWFKYEELRRLRCILLKNPPNDRFSDQRWGCDGERLVEVRGRVSDLTLVSLPTWGVR